MMVAGCAVWVSESLTAATIPCFVEAKASSSAHCAVAPSLHISPMKEGQAALPALRYSPQWVLGSTHWGQAHGLDAVVGT